MKKIALLFALSLLLTGCGSAESSAAASDSSAAKTPPQHIESLEPYYDDLSALAGNSMAVFEGKVNKSHGEYIDDSTGAIVDESKTNVDAPNIIRYTVYDVTVTKTYKGEVKEKSDVQVRMLGDQKELISENAVYIDEGGEYLFFTNYKENDLSLPMWTPNQMQGFYTRQGDKFVPADEKQNSLSFTASELEAQLAE